MKLFTLRETKIETFSYTREKIMRIIIHNTSRNSNYIRIYVMNIKYKNNTHIVFI